MNFRLHALDKEEFERFFLMDEEQLKAHKAVKMIVDEKPGYPCRVSLQDAEVGEEVLLLNYACLHHGSPYDGSSAIFVRKDAQKATPAPNEIPLMFRHRLLSLRGYANNWNMVAAAVVQGKELETALQAMFEDKEVGCIHIHNAGPGCINCVVTREAE